MERTAIAGVGFDLDHTIAIDNKLERVAFLRLLEQLCADGGRTLGTLSDEIDHIDALLAHQRSGDFSIDEAVQRFVLERGVPPRDAYVERFRALALEMVDQFIIAMPGARRTFDALRARGIPIAVLSNGWNPLQIRKAERAGFDGVVLASADIGQQKPGPRAFAALLETLGTAPEDTWYVGDDPHGDIAGARDAGLHEIWINADRRAYPPDLPPPRYTIHALEEVLGIVPSPARTPS